jgi:RNA polymerase sigma-70 factor, ECF subfamily
VSELYLCLLRTDHRQWENRRHFYAFAASAMRNILIDRYRAKKSTRRLPNDKKIALDNLLPSQQPSVQATAHKIQLGLALQRLRDLSPRQAEMVELRFFGGLEIRELAEKLNLSEKTVQRDWIAARAFLYAELNGATK